MAASGGSFGFVPVADNTKQVGANLVQIAAGAGVAQTVTPIVPQQGATIINLSSNWIRVGWVYAAGVSGGGAAANRVTIVPPNFTQTIDFGDVDGDNSLAALDAVASVTVIATLNPSATAEAGTLGAATAAVAGTVVLNWISP
jgi:hypothetical protein